MTIRGQWQWTLCVDSHHVIFVQPAAAAVCVCVCVCCLSVCLIIFPGVLPCNLSLLQHDSYTTSLAAAATTPPSPMLAHL